MAVTGAPSDWQLECENVEQRCGYLLKYELWSDCTFVLGSKTKQEFRTHKLILASASPVFEAMLFGGLSEPNDPIVHIPDVDPEAFKALLQFIYTGELNIDSFDMACDLWIHADKYILPHLVKKITNLICSLVGPSNACKAYKLAHLYNDEEVMKKCVQIISTNTKEVLNDSSFEEVELNTLITICSLDNLTVDSELDLFQAVEKYAEAELEREGQSSPPKNAESSSATSPAAELDAPTEELSSEPTCDKQHLEEVPEGLRLSLRAAIEKIRFLSLSAQEFAAGPARSGLLTRNEKYAVVMNIASKDSIEPMPTGFSLCREQRQPRNDSKGQCQRIKAGVFDHIIDPLKCGDPSQVKTAAWAAAKILNTSRDFQPALDEGILDALVPALTEGDDECKRNAVYMIRILCDHGSPSQLSVLAASAALEPYCRLMTSRWSNTCLLVLSGLTDLLKNVEENTKVALLRKLREIGVPQLLMTVLQNGHSVDREYATDLMRYFSHNEQ